MNGHVRFGPELEGPHKGLPTLVLLSARHHDVGLVLRLLAEHGREAQHVWVQCQPHETYDWDRVAGIADWGFKVTAQMRTPADMPGVWPAGVSLVWRVPDDLAPMVAACTHMAVFGGGGPFDGAEAEVRWRGFDAARYAADEVWECE